MSKSSRENIDLWLLLRGRYRAFGLSPDAMDASIQLLTLLFDASTTQLPSLKEVKVESESPILSVEMRNTGCGGVNPFRQDVFTPIIELSSDSEGDPIQLLCRSSLSFIS